MFWNVTLLYLQNLKENGKFLDACDLPKLNQKDRNNLKNRDQNSKSLPKMKSQRLERFIAEF
jgi:hypothetical protein